MEIVLGNECSLSPAGQTLILMGTNASLAGRVTNNLLTFKLARIGAFVSRWTIAGLLRMIFGIQSGTSLTGETLISAWSRAGIAAMVA